jgi:hypothetical protein
MKKEALEGLSLEHILDDRYLDLASPQSKAPTPHQLPPNDHLSSTAGSENKSEHVKGIMDEFHALLELIDSRRIEDSFDQRSKDFALYFPPKAPHYEDDSNVLQSHQSYPEEVRYSRDSSLRSSRAHSEKDVEIRSSVGSSDTSYISQHSSERGPKSQSSYVSMLNGKAKIVITESQQQQKSDEEEAMLGIGANTALPFPSFQSHNNANARIPRYQRYVEDKQVDEDGDVVVSEEDSLDRIHSPGVFVTTHTERDFYPHNNDATTELMRTFTSSTALLESKKEMSSHRYHDQSIPEDILGHAAAREEIEKLRRIKDSLMFTVQSEQASRMEYEKKYNQLQVPIFDKI